MKQKFTVICFCEAQIVLFQSFICITSVIFCLITYVVVTSSFWLCLKFCAHKIATSYVFEDYLHNLSRHCLLNAHWMPKKMLEDSDFFQHCACKSAVFGCVFLNNLQSIRPLMKLTTCLWFLSFCFSDKMTTNSCHMKTGNF